MFHVTGPASANDCTVNAGLVSVLLVNVSTLASVESVPVTGNVTLVDADVVRVKGKAPDVVKAPAVVSVPIVVTPEPKFRLPPTAIERAVSPTVKVIARFAVSVSVS